MKSTSHFLIGTAFATCAAARTLTLSGTVDTAVDSLSYYRVTECMTGLMKMLASMSLNFQGF